MPEFMRVDYTALTDEDLAGIVRICKLNPIAVDPKKIIQRIAGQELSFWRLRDEKADVRLVFQINVHPDGNELLIWGVFGRGLFGRFADIAEFCKLMANKYFCRYITGEVYSKGLMKLYETIGAKPVFTKYMLEV